MCFSYDAEPPELGMNVPSPVDSAADTKVPVLGLFGGGDESAPHSFFDRSYEQFAQESADAWERVLDFISRLERTSAAV